MHASKNIFIGTSGWSYAHWKGSFYPEGLKAAAQFDYYAQRFDTVELNSPFYHLPTEKTFLKWRNESPEGFVFAVKASRYITHMKKLKEPKESLKEFMQHVVLLKEKLGPILFQLPPGWNINVERLAAFMQSLPHSCRFVFEFRNPTWYHKEVYALLQKYNCAFCIYELDGHFSPAEITADFVYVRLHGPGEKYAGNYSPLVLRQWAKKCRDWLQQKKTVYVYFDNDEAGYAAFNAKTLQQLI
jgi:uncharacterized protein YecE (DUF72 family)